MSRDTVSLDPESVEAARRAFEAYRRETTENVRDLIRRRDERRKREGRPIPKGILHELRPEDIDEDLDRNADGQYTRSLVRVEWHRWLEAWTAACKHLAEKHGS